MSSLLMMLGILGTSESSEPTDAQPQEEKEEAGK